MTGITRAQIESNLREIIDARHRGDAATVTRHFAADAVYLMSGTPELGPMTESHCGPANIHAGVSHLI